MASLLRALVGLVPLLWGWMTGRSGARTKAALDAAEDAVTAYEVRNEVDNRIARERNARERLRDRWQRDE